MTAIAELGADSDSRQARIVEVLASAFEDLIEADPRPFRRRRRD